VEKEKKMDIPPSLRRKMEARQAASGEMSMSDLQKAVSEAEVKPKGRTKKDLQEAVYNTAVPDVTNSKKE